MTQNQNPKKYDQEERAMEFAKKVRFFVRKLPVNTGNEEDAKQLIRSSGSIGANYIEANESLGKKDCVMHMKISRKEAKESLFWLNLLDCGDNADLEKEQALLLQESKELMSIFGAIIRKMDPS